MLVAKIILTIGLRALGLGILLPALASAFAQPAAPAGTWTTEHGDAKIRIAACGPALCGTIVWLAEPADSSGRPKTDINNSDEAKRSRPLIGLTILTGLASDGQEWRGRVYNSDDGKDYDVWIKLVDKQHASIKGCTLDGLFCGGEMWTKN